VGRHPLRLGDDEQFGLLAGGRGRHTGGDQESFGKSSSDCQVCVHVAPSQKWTGEFVYIPDALGP
jgi:hypothetical protein